jgi:hypothetical protein
MVVTTRHEDTRLGLLGTPGLVASRTIGLRVKNLRSTKRPQSASFARLGPRTGQVDLTGKFFATANAPRSSVSKAIFWANMTSPATKLSLGTKHQPALGRPTSSSS